MAQLTIYLDGGTLKRVETAARQTHVSVSQWVKTHLLQTFRQTWPVGYFEEVCGSLAGESLARPPQPSFRHDARRQRV